MLRKPRHFSLLLVMMSFLASMVVVPPAPRAGLAAETVEIIYVKAVGGSDDNDGQSWDTAFATLQKALDAAEPGDDVRVEIWLAAGTYYPTKDAAGNDTGGSSATFRMKNGVTIYGGFPADADDGIDLDERGWEAHPTVLSGDLNKNGTLDFGTDAQHVIFNEGLDETAVLDGVIITGGISPDDGGGVYNKNSSPVFRHVKIETNWAQSRGGGMYNENSSPTLEDVQFQDNKAIVGSGGSFYNNNSQPRLSNVTITGSEALDRGGGIFNFQSDPVMEDVVISDGKANKGGGMYNENSSPQLERVVIRNNTAINGGGMYNAASHPKMTDVEIRDNKAQNGNPSLNSENLGGGMYNDASNPEMLRVILWGNTADKFGGGMFNRDNSSPTLINTLVVHNFAHKYGGGIYNDGSYPRLYNTTVARNRIDLGTTEFGQAGAGIYNHLGSLAALYNTIVATNGIPGQSNADNIYPEPDLDKYGDRFKNSFFHNISNGYSLPVIFGDDFRLDPSKGWTPQLIDQGDNSLVQSDTDLAGNPRIYNGTVDLGAYELYHVDLSDLEVKVDGTAINLNFDPFITAYFTGLDEDAGNVTINPSTSYTDALVEISINGGGFISIAFDQDNPVPLKAGENIIKVRVRSKTYAELQQTYTLTILWGETRAAKPVADPPGGPVPRRTDVKLSTATAGANIFYTTDGSDPSDPSSNRYFYSSPITINGDVTIKAVAVRGGYLDSEVMVEHYTVVEPFAGGGTENDPFLIGDAGELLAFNKFQADYLDKHFRLVNDIVFDEGVWDEHVWWPVGNFNGTFDGNGHIIRGLVVDQGADVVGMFGTIGADGKVKNLHLEAVEVKGGNYVGGIAGIVDGGQVAGSSAVGAVRGHSFVGGLVGDNRGTVTGSYFSGSVTGSSDSVGGLLGRSSSKVTHSYSVGSVQGVNNVGGLVGEGQLMAGYSLEHSYAAVSVKGNERVGGLMGMGWPGGLHVTHSWASGDVQGVLDVGGLIGQIGIPVSYVYAVGAVSPNPQYEGETENFGGLTGRNAANAFSYGYSLGKVVGNVAGGLMGQSTFAMESMDWNNEANQQATSARPLRPCHCRTRWRCKEVM